MNYLVTGIKVVDFTNKEGEKVQGTRVYFVYADEFDDSVTGQIADSKWLTPLQIEKLKVDLKSLINKRVNFVTNLKGNIVQILQEG